MMMESTTLSMIHRGGCFNERKEQAEVEPRNCQKDNEGKEEKTTRDQENPNRQQAREERKQDNQNTKKQKAGKTAGNPCLTL